VILSRLDLMACVRQRAGGGLESTPPDKFHRKSWEGWENSCPTTKSLKTFYGDRHTVWVVFDEFCTSMFNSTKWNFSRYCVSVSILFSCFCVILRWFPTVVRWKWDFRRMHCFLCSTLSCILTNLGHTAVITVAMEGLSLSISDLY